MRIVIIVEIMQLKFLPKFCTVIWSYFYQSMLTFDLVHLRCEFRHQFLYCGDSWGCWGKNNPGAIKAHIRGKCYGVPITPAASKICLHWGREPFSSLVVGSSFPCLFQFPTVVSFSREPTNNQQLLCLWKVIRSWAVNNVLLHLLSI